MPSADIQEYEAGRVGLRTETLDLLLRGLGATLADLARAAGEPLNLRKMREDYDEMLERLAILERAVFPPDSS